MDYPPPIIKEFDRTGEEAVESGLPMAYVQYEKIIDTSHLTKKGVLKQQRIYHNSYYHAIKVIFNNLSDEHHALFRDRFKLSEIWSIPKKMVEVTEESQNRKSKKRKSFNALYSGTSLYFKKIPVPGDGNCALYAMRIKREELVESLTHFIGDVEGSRLLQDEIYEAFFSKAMISSDFDNLSSQYNQASLPQGSNVALLFSGGSSPSNKRPRNNASHPPIQEKSMGNLSQLAIQASAKDFEIPLDMDDLSAQNEAQVRVGQKRKKM